MIKNNTFRAAKLYVVEYQVAGKVYRSMVDDLRQSRLRAVTCRAIGQEAKVVKVRG